MQTYNRICIKDWEITAKNGDHFKVERGQEYLTSPALDGKVTVFSTFWVPVPVLVFAGAVEFTPA
ncbi:MAG: hypothetical protein ACTSY1_02325 [Alphaproteobacteria bacterium]